MTHFVLRIINYLIIFLLNDEPDVKIDELYDVPG